jgi:hypothetical protein
LKSLLLILITILSNAVFAKKLDLNVVDHFKVLNIKVQGKEFRAILDSGSNINAIDPRFENLLTDTKVVEIGSSNKKNKSKVGKLSFQFDENEEKMDFASFSTNVNGSCCEMILGRDFS